MCGETRNATRTCRQCKIEKPVEAFIRKKDCKHGRDRLCKECRRAYIREWKRSNKKERLPKTRRYYKEHEAKARKANYQRLKHEDPLRFRAEAIRRNMLKTTKRTGLPYDKEYLSIKGLIKLLKRQDKCPCCKRIMDMVGPGKELRYGDNRISVDRIVPRKGYVKGNIAFICWRCNNLKRDAKIKELEEIVVWMKKIGAE